LCWGDWFRFAKNAAFLPFVPLIEGGKALLQPTYVSDVADAIVKIIEVRPNRDVNLI
jgi:nucleoside-diphosphate-sugar epimerase